MKRALLMISLTLFPRLLVAQELNITSLAGEDWYGLYLNGQKAGYAVSKLTIDAGGRVEVSQDAQFKVNQGGVPQDIRMKESRVYAADGSLIHIESDFADLLGPPKRFDARSASFRPP